MIKNKLIIYRSQDLEPGFIGNTCSFEHRAFNDRSERAQDAYRRLRDDLLQNGMMHPLITYKGHILIGMRRFEILRQHRNDFLCYEVLEEVDTWRAEDIKRLKEFKEFVYGDSLNQFMG